VSNRTPSTSPWLRLFLVLAVLGAPALSADRALAQGNFRVTWSVEKTGPTHVELAGVVVNNSSQDALDVYVTAAAVDASGKILARGIAFVAPQIPARRSSEFSARVPNVPGTTVFRVSVSNFRFGLGRSESP
jgi:hypothetical protein